MTTVPELQTANDKPNLVRKAKRVVGFMAPMSATLPDAITDASGVLQELPAEYFALGLVSPDGYTFTAETESTPTPALGYASPVREDITSINRQITVTLLEHGKRQVQELLHGLDLSGASQSTGGEVTFDELDLPIHAERRLIVIGDDGPASANWLFARGFPRVKVASVGETVWGSEGTIVPQLTLTAFTDADLGTPVRHYLGGTGASGASADLGYGTGV